MAETDYEAIRAELIATHNKTIKAHKRKRVMHPECPIALEIDTEENLRDDSWLSSAEYMWDGYFFLAVLDAGTICKQVEKAAENRDDIDINDFDMVSECAEEGIAVCLHDERLPVVLISPHMVEEHTVAASIEEFFAALVPFDVDAYLEEFGLDSFE